MRLFSLETSSGYFAKVVIYAKCALNIAILFLALLFVWWAIVPIFIIALSGAVFTACNELIVKLNSRAKQVKPALTSVESFVNDNILSSDNVLVVSHI